jgi:hypothetical protein
VFVRRGTTWSQQAYLKASNPEEEDEFGWSLAVSGDTVVVAAYEEDSNAIGVNGDQGNNGAEDSGAAYIFTGLGLDPQLTLASDGSGGYVIRFTGHVGFRYELQRAAEVTGPWDTIATQTAPSSGLVEFHDTSSPPGQAFYRTVQL